VRRLASRVRRDESGVSLILAIVFIVVAGAIGGSMLSGLATGTYTRNTLDLARNREYAADGAIETAIAQTRTNMTNGVVGSNPYCPSPAVSQTLNNVPITVDCTYAPTLTLSGLGQRNVVYSAHCTSVSGSLCVNTAPIIRAQVNFESADPLFQAAINVSNTYIQSWTVVES